MREVCQLPDEVLIEEYLQGPEYSVEIFGGEIIGITRKYLSREPYFVEIGHDFPAQAPHKVLLALGEGSHASAFSSRTLLGTGPY